MAKNKVAKSDKTLIEINVDELKEFVTHIVHNNRFLQAGGKVPVCVNVEGDAGLGKTSAIMQLSKQLGLNCIRLNLAEIEELGDLGIWKFRNSRINFLIPQSLNSLIPQSLNYKFSASWSVAYRAETSLSSPSRVTADMGNTF